jgi:hypothetical protein
MILPFFLIPPALGLLFAARYAAFYWEVSADLWSVYKHMTASADIVPFPSTRRSAQSVRGGQHNAEIVRFGPSGR